VPDPGTNDRKPWDKIAGRRRNRITIQQATNTLDAAGQPIPTWSTYLADYPVAIDSVAGGEVLRGRQVSAETTLVFSGRWYTGVTTQMRVSYEGRTLGIVRASDPYGDRRELRIECKEAV
jgi:SPP1 family predicted phage head-tail adaptor